MESEKKITPVQDEAAIIQRNIARWKEEQERKKKKAQERAAEAQRKGITVAELMQDRRQRYLLKSCRATISEIVKTHGGGK